MYVGLKVFSKGRPVPIVLSVPASILQLSRYAVRVEKYPKSIQIVTQHKDVADLVKASIDLIATMQKYQVERGLSVG